MSVIDAGQENAREASGKLLTSLHIGLVQFCYCIRVTVFIVVVAFTGRVAYQHH